MEELARAAVQWAVPVVLAALAASLMRLYRLMDAMQEGTRTMLRSRLVDLHERYVVSGRGCPDWVKQERPRRSTGPTTAWAATAPAPTTTRKSSMPLSGEIWRTSMEKYEEWAIAALTRAVKTAAQTAVALIGTGAVGFTDLDWLQIASVSGVAAVVSLLTSVATDLPEVGGAQPGPSHEGGEE